MILPPTLRGIWSSRMSVVGILNVSVPFRRRAAERSATDEYMLPFASVRHPAGADRRRSSAWLGGEFWAQVRDWGRLKRSLAPADVGILDVAASIPLRLPTEKQSLKLIESSRSCRRLAASLMFRANSRDLQTKEFLGEEHFEPLHQFASQP